MNERVNSKFLVMCIRVFKWYKRFKNGKEVEHGEHLGRLCSKLTIDENIEKIIQNNQRLGIRILQT